MHVQMQVGQAAIETDDLVETQPPTLEALYPDELARWLVVMGLPMLAACICIGLAFGTSFTWLYGGAILFGPGLGVFAIIYLAISCDTNGSNAHAAFEQAKALRAVARTQAAA